MGVYGVAAAKVIARPVAPDAAIEYWRQRAKLTDAEAKALGAGAKHRAFYVSGLARRDLVQQVSDGIQAALKNGETLADFKKRIAEAIEAEGWHGYRVENIFRTNLQVAYSAGRYKKMQAVKASRPYWQYIAIVDRRTRPGHAILHLFVYPADHEFWAANYPPNGFRCRCGVRTLSERQVRAMGLDVQTKMPGPGVWTDPKTDMEYFVHFPGADKGFRNNPGADWLAGLDLKKYPDLTPKSYEEQRGPASKRPAPAANVAELGEQIKARCSDFATNAGIRRVKFDHEGYFMATNGYGTLWVSQRRHGLGGGKTFTASEELLSAWNKLSAGKPLSWNEEYSVESLWHEITHNRQKGNAGGERTVKRRLMETVTQWTARRTYPELLEALGGKAAHQADILKNGLGYGQWIKNFDRLLETLGVSDDVLLPALKRLMAEQDKGDYGEFLASFLTAQSGRKKSAIKKALSKTDYYGSFDDVLRWADLI